MAKNVDMDLVIPEKIGGEVSKKALAKMYFKGFAKKNYKGIAIVAGILVALIAYFAFVPDAVRGVITQRYLWLLLAFAIGVLISIKQGTTSAVLTGAILAVLVGGLFIYAPDLQAATFPTFGKIQGTVYDALNKPQEKLFGLIERAATGGLPKQEGPNFESRVLRNKVMQLDSFIILTRDPLRADFNIKIDAPEKTALDARCFLDNEEITASPGFIEVDEDNPFARITCSGGSANNKKELTLKVTGDFKSESLMEVKLGPRESGLGAKGKSSPKIAGPYDVSLETVEPMPFREERAYGFYLKFAKLESNSLLNEVRSLKFSKISENYGISCEGPIQGQEISLSRIEIDQRVVDKNRDAFSYSCSINVGSLPGIVESSIVSVSSTYNVEKEFKQSLS